MINKETKYNNLIYEQIPRMFDITFNFIGRKWVCPCSVCVKMIFVILLITVTTLIPSVNICLFLLFLATIRTLVLCRSVTVRQQLQISGDV